MQIFVHCKRQGCSAVRRGNATPYRVWTRDTAGHSLPPKAGWGLSIRSAACHGVGMQSAGTPGPDLRESPIALQLDSLRKLLKSGALMDRGMPRFDMLSDAEIRQIHAYIRARARESLGTRKADSGPAPARM